MTLSHGHRAACARSGVESLAISDDRAALDAFFAAEYQPQAVMHFRSV